MKPKNKKKTAKGKPIVIKTKGKLNMKQKKKGLKEPVRQQTKINKIFRLKNIPLKERMVKQLKASRFRYLNEQFYSSSSREAKEYFTENPDEFNAYHEGYKEQISEWPLNPVDVIIKQIKNQVQANKKIIIADFGCGEAKIARSFPGTTVFSLDLVALNELVTVCDMTDTFLHKNSVDIAIFCLSLMGTNLSSCFREANRVLKEGGTMKIAEVQSRIENVNEFVKSIEKYGFQCISKDLSHNVFYFLNFKKSSSISKHQKRKLPEVNLKPCLYKRR